MTNRYRRWPFSMPQPQQYTVQIRLYALAAGFLREHNLLLVQQLCSRGIGFYSGRQYWRQMEPQHLMRATRYFWTTKGCAW